MDSELMGRFPSRFQAAAGLHEPYLHFQNIPELDLILLATTCESNYLIWS
jgi:hypothetical protein